MLVWSSCDSFGRCEIKEISSQAAAKSVIKRWYLVSTSRVHWFSVGATQSKIKKIKEKWGKKTNLKTWNKTKNLGKRARRWHSISTFKAQFTTNIYNCQLATKQAAQTDLSQRSDRPAKSIELRIQVIRTGHKGTAGFRIPMRWFFFGNWPLTNCRQFVSIKHQPLMRTCIENLL